MQGPSPHRRPCACPAPGVSAPTPASRCPWAHNGQRPGTPGAPTTRRLLPVPFRGSPPPCSPVPAVVCGRWVGRRACSPVVWGRWVGRRDKFENFEEEVQYIINHDRRNKFIRNLALDLKGNTLVLFARVEGHGEPLYHMINNNTVDERQVFFVHGGVDTKDREQVREITEKENNAIIVASYGTFSTGINIKNLHNVIFASPSKSRIRNLQSIGRVLRKGNNKTKATLYDIADDISYKSRRNYTLNHLIERIKVYNEENFNYDIVNIPLKN